MTSSNFEPSELKKSTVIRNVDFFSDRLVTEASARGLCNAECNSQVFNDTRATPATSSTDGGADEVVDFNASALVLREVGTIAVMTLNAAMTRRRYRLAKDGRCRSYTIRNASPMNLVLLGIPRLSWLGYVR